MNKKFIFILIFLSVLVLPAFSSGNWEFRKNGIRTFSDNAMKWDRQNIKSYTIKVAYVVGNIVPNVYDITVQDGKVISFFQNDQKSDDLVFAETYTVKSLFETIKAYVHENRKKDPLLYMVEYDSKYGFVNSCTRIYNPNVKRGAVPSDMNFRIRVLEFVPENKILK